MSGLNGNRARFQINRVRKMHRRQRIQALVAGLKKGAGELPVEELAPPTAPLAASTKLVPPDPGD